ncbi:Uncharacterised protein [Mycobacterium tuberculosis]|nr:Uncharacterised protein [Mycobacterium tuberculosis]
MHSMPRNVARIAAIAAIAVGSGAVVAVPSAVADIGADMRFECAGEAGTHTVGLRIETSAPSSGAVGRPVQLGTIKVGVDIPAELAKEVQAKSPGEASAPPKAAGVAPSSTIGGVAEVPVTLREPGRDRRGGWPAFALAAEPSPGDGSVHLTGSGVAPPVVPESPGGLSWEARELNLSLVPDEAATSPDKAALSLRCVAERGAVLGTVQVSQEDQAPAPAARSGVSAQADAPTEDVCKEIPGPGRDPRYAINQDPTLMKVFDEPEMPDGMKPLEQDGLPYCIKATGFANVKKAGTAVPLAAETLLRRSTTQYSPIDTINGPNYIQQQGYVVNKTYPTSGTILGFGFMPTQAETEAVQVGAPNSGKNDPITGNANISILQGNQRVPDVIKEAGLDIATYIRVKVGTAGINGVPMDLGENCMSGRTLLSAHGFLGNQQTDFQNPTDGEAVIAKDLTIPEFSGCGVTEDLSPLLTASISGSGNYVSLEAGTWCVPDSGAGCTNGASKLPSTWTIERGGDITAVAEPFVLAGRGSKFSCDSATMRFHLDPQHWRTRNMLTRARSSFEGCKLIAADGTVYPTDATQEGEFWVHGFLINSEGITLKLSNIVINAPTEVNGRKCVIRFTGSATQGFFDKVEIPGYALATYDNETGLMVPDFWTGTKVSPNSTCTIRGFTKDRPVDTVDATFALQPRPIFKSP